MDSPGHFDIVHSKLQLTGNCLQEAVFNVV